MPSPHVPIDGRPAIHSLDHLVLSVPELKEAECFFTAFGLDVRHAEDTLELRCFGSDHTWVKLVADGGRRVREIVFGAYADAMNDHRSTLAALGVDDLQHRNDGSLAFRDPEGVPLRIVPAEKCSPDAKAVPSDLHHPAPAGTYGAPLRSKAKTVTPRRFAHALFFTADVARNIDFYGDALGLRLSDEAGGEGAFLHGAHGSEHHMIAFAKERGPGFHHTSWDVGSVQEIGLGMAQMAKAGHGEDGWGLGRHVLGSNYFHYVRDPWGSYAEYSFDMDYIPAGHAWKPGHHRLEDAFSLWAPPPPEGFGRNREFQVEPR